MADLQAEVRYPGIEQVESASITRGMGITPSVFQISIAPQARAVETDGTLELSFGNVRISFLSCHLDSSSLSYNANGYLVSLNLVDRRWKWQYGSISGSYNLRNDDFTIRSETEKTPRQLATLCFEAMGENNFDVGALPNVARPTVEWEGENPAQALANLCDDLGCRIVLRLGGNVRIVKANVGAPLPPGPVMDEQIADDPAERPDGITILCGRNRYQADFLTEAVGLDKDGKIKPIDDLSYKPAGGWNVADLPDFQSLADKELVQLAKMSVFRWYRIKASEAAPINLPGYGLIKDLAQILPIESEQVDVGVIDGVVKNKPARAYGVWFVPNMGRLTNNVEELTPLGADDDETSVPPFQVDEARGMIVFDRPVYLQGGTEPALTLEPATIRLRTAVSVRDPETHAWVRYERSRPSRFRRLNTRNMVIRRDEIVLSFAPFYRLDFADFRVFDNRAEVNPEADFYIDAAEAEFEPKNPASALYAGILRVEPDGALQTIEWTVGAQGATTKVHRNQDFGTATTIPYRIQRANERAQGLAEVKRQLDLQNLRRDVQKAQV